MKAATGSTSCSETERRRDEDEPGNAGTQLVFRPRSNSGIGRLMRLEAGNPRVMAIIK